MNLYRRIVGSLTSDAQTSVLRHCVHTQVVWNPEFEDGFPSKDLWLCVKCGQRLVLPMTEDDYHTIRAGLLVMTYSENARLQADAKDALDHIFREGTPWNR